MQLLRHLFIVWVVAAFAAVALPGCITKGQVVKPQTPYETAVLALAEAKAVLAIRAKDIGNGVASTPQRLTPNEAQAKLNKVKGWLKSLDEAKRLADLGNLAAGKDRLKVLKVFLAELETYLTDKGVALTPSGGG